MIDPKSLYDSLDKNGISFYAGVPDSLLKDFCAYVTDHKPSSNNVICANEGAAVALATGHYLATGNPGLVYMQNSGLGNATNPLLSLADTDVYGIPMLLMIGWRGEPGKKDEPQHVKQGKVTPHLLESMQIPYQVIDSESGDINRLVKKTILDMKKNSSPYAFLVKKGTFSSYKLKNRKIIDSDLTREDAIGIILNQLRSDDVVVATTGKTSRELFECREKLEASHAQDFLTVGSMGHTSQIALGIALRKKSRHVYCLDGDGSIIMHMGSLAVIGQQAPANFKHVVLNNGAHDSVGGQPTAGMEINFGSIAKANGYKHAWQARSRKSLIKAMREFNKCKGPALLEILVNKGSRDDLGRPTTTPSENKNSFMDFLKRA